MAATSWYAWEKESMVQAHSQKNGAFLNDCKPEQQLFYAAMDLFGVKKDVLAIIEQCWPEQ